MGVYREQLEALSCTTELLWFTQLSRREATDNPATGKRGGQNALQEVLQEINERGCEECKK